jgi:hypothetical protein
MIDFEDERLVFFRVCEENAERVWLGHLMNLRWIFSNHPWKN